MEKLRSDHLCITYGSSNTKVSAVEDVSLTLQKGVALQAGRIVSEKAVSR